jgi:hypothetical protein
LHWPDCIAIISTNLAGSQIDPTLKTPKYKKRIRGKRTSNTHSAPLGMTTVEARMSTNASLDPISQEISQAATTISREPSGSRVKKWGALASIVVLACIITGAVVGSKENRSSGSERADSLDVSPAQSTSSSDAPSYVPSDAPPGVPSYVSSNAPSDFPSGVPSIVPTGFPTGFPSTIPSSVPSNVPSNAPSDTPSSIPTPRQSQQPSLFPSVTPTFGPTTTDAPTNDATDTPSDSPTEEITYNPGQLTVSENGLLLSEGLTSRLLARTGDLVQYDGGGESEIPFHTYPDAGAVFVDERSENEGGWIYVTNSEDRDLGQGGAFSVTFDSDGKVIDYRPVLLGTSVNCGGGRTPFGAWISCEETNGGQNWQVDPTGAREARAITLGNDGGIFESFAYDIRNLDVPRFYVTEDRNNGALQRFTPDDPDWNDPWEILYGNGTTDFLILDSHFQETFSWTTDREAAKASASAQYPNSEGIDVYENELYFVSKARRRLFILNLDDGTYTSQSTQNGLFDGQPDQVKRILGADSDNLLYFTEDGGTDAGVHSRNDLGQFFTILESPVYDSETTGLSFSPDGRHLYIAYQNDGLLFDITRTDGFPFQAQTLNVKFHEKVAE